MRRLAPPANFSKHPVPSALDVARPHCNVYSMFPDFVLFVIVLLSQETIVLGQNRD
jgi:hypothetical protein